MTATNSQQKNVGEKLGGALRQTNKKTLNKYYLVELKKMVLPFKFIERCALTLLANTFHQVSNKLLKTP